jgi:hypothetical protein
MSGEHELVYLPTFKHLSMSIYFECIFEDRTYEHRVPDGLFEYDEVSQLMRECRADTAVLPFSLKLRDSANFMSSPAEAPLSSTLDAMHELELDDRLHDACPRLCEIKATPLIPDLDESKRKDIGNLLEEFADLYSSGKDDLGCISDPDICHQIHLQPNSYPPSKFRNMSSYSEREKEFLSGEVKMLLELGIIRQSTSPWVSAPVIVKKSDNTLRLCIDFRPLNACTVSDPYPLPLIESMLRKMASAKYFSAMDIASAIWQVKMHPEHAKYTAFVTHEGKYEWLRMPFGLRNASSTFQRLMDNVLGAALFSHAYLDDVHVYSNTWEEHVKHLRDTFVKLALHKVKLKRPKCIFGAEYLKTLGHVVGGGCLRLDPDNVAAILNLPTPRDVSTTRSVLGAAGYYREYVENFARITEPLSRLLKKTSVFHWTPDCQTAFDQVKHCLTSEPVLWAPNFKLPFILTTDWSKTAMGAVLSQPDPMPDEHGNHFDHPIAYASKTLKPAERNYSPTEGECFALVWACEKFRPFLHGRRFIAYTHHAPLQYLDSKRHTNSKLERWAIRLQEFDIDIRYKKGADNLVADCLSRCVHLEALHVFAVTPAWELNPQKQTDLDSVPCVICGFPQGDDNIVLCDGCNRCFHLRCLFPPRSIVPGGCWFCPACDPYLGKGGELKIEELKSAETPLCCHRHDPYRDDLFMEYVRSQHNLDLLTGLPPKQAAEFRRRG